MWIIQTAVIKYLKAHAEIERSIVMEIRKSITRTFQEYRDKTNSISSKRIFVQQFFIIKAEAK